MIQYIFIIGATGKVGKTLVNQIIERGDGDFATHNNPTIIVGLASSNNFIFSKDGLSKKQCLDFANNEGSMNTYKNPNDLHVKVRKAGYGFERKLVFVDLSASPKMLDFHVKINEDKMMSVVTANKHPLSICDYETFSRLTGDIKSYGYRCSVMAGAEAVILLQDLFDMNDPPTAFSGCFSGTLGYICTEVEKGKEISKVIKEAKELGYTEPHPRDDLSGIDVARKLLILSRTAGYRVNMSEIKINSFIPEEYLKEDDAEKFIENLKNLDKVFFEKVKAAKEKGNVLRYIAKMEIIKNSPHLTVSLEEVEKNSFLGALKGTSNKIMVVSKVYSKENPYIVEAPGAGLDITAQNIRRDLLYQLDGRKSFK